jgi:colicin import membrane protein
VDDPAAAKAYALSILGNYGWSAAEMTALNTLWEKESNWKTTATNASSGAYGIVQSLPAGKMASAGADWQTNYQTQIKWGLNYIKERYGSPSAALGFHLANNWY